MGKSGVTTSNFLHSRCCFPFAGRVPVFSIQGGAGGDFVGVAIGGIIG